MLKMSKGSMENLYRSVLETYDRVMTIERDPRCKDLVADQQWQNIMYSVLSLMLSTDADDHFLNNPGRMDEYDRMLAKYGSFFNKKGTKVKSHIPPNGQELEDLRRKGW